MGVTTNRFTFHRRALLVLNALSPAEQGQVREKLEALEALSRLRWLKDELKPLPTEADTYLLRAGPDWRLIVRVPEGEQPEELDIVHHDTLAAFAEKAS
jgi:hypothetical protein